ncbi:MAG TPA: hypothetical protein VEK57_29335 [Thermoanaerobaculia bacterium]|nr:hypothetical protein [Thermoanaerobaculia bacterium]
MARQVTITLDEDVAAKLEGEARRTGISAEDVANTTLRQSLPDAEVQPVRFKVRPRHMGVPRIDLECTGRALAMLDELDEK